MSIGTIWRLVPARLLRTLKDQGTSRGRLVDAAVLTGCNIAAGALGFIAILCIARVLGKSEFGEYAYAVTLGQYACVLVIFAGDRTLVRDLVQQAERRYAILAAGLFLRLCLLGVILLLAVITLLLPGDYALSVGQILVVVGTAIGALTVEGLFDYWGQYRRHGLYNLTWKATFALLVCLPMLVAVFHLNMLWLGMATVLSAVALLCLQGTYIAKRLSWLDLRFDRRDVADVIRSNRMLWISSLVLVSYIGLNRIVLRNVSGSGELGGYAAGAKLIDMAVLCLLQISRLGRPRMAAVVGKDVTAECRRSFVMRYLAGMLGLSLLFAVPALLFPRLLMTTFFGAGYADAAGPLRVLSIYLVVLAAGIVAAQYVISRRDDHLYFLSAVVGGVLAVLACALLIPRWGAVGAAWALLLSHGVSMLLYCVAMGVDLRRTRDE